MNPALHAAHELWLQNLRSLVESEVGSAKNDVTSEFLSISEVVRNRVGVIDAVRLADYTLILVPALATDRSAQVGKLTGKLGLTPPEGFLDSFFQAKRFLDEVNQAGSPSIDWVLAPINQEAGCDANGDTIAKTVLAATKKVIVVTQSKGGVDFLHGLIRHPEIHSRIAAWVAYQPPHAGSVLADLAESNVLDSLFDSAVFRLLSGSGQALLDMTTWVRAQYNKVHALEIAALPSKFPIVTLVTKASPVDPAIYAASDKKQFHFLTPFVKTIYDHGGGVNDGIASVRGTCLPGSACINWMDREIDHFESAMDTAPFVSLNESERVTLFRTMIDMAVSRAKAK
jgi:hypothetical protein